VLAHARRGDAPGGGREGHGPNIPFIRSPAFELPGSAPAPSPSRSSTVSSLFASEGPARRFEGGSTASKDEDGRERAVSRAGSPRVWGELAQRSLGVLTAGCRLGSCRRRLAGLRCGAFALGGPEGIGACEALVLACVPCLHRRRCSARGRLRRRRGRCRRLARPTRACLSVSGCATRAGYSRARRREEREGCRRPSPRARAACMARGVSSGALPGRASSHAPVWRRAVTPAAATRRTPSLAGRRCREGGRGVWTLARLTALSGRREYFSFSSSHGPVHVLRCSRHRKDAEEDAE
jgi:hypothetical protein